MSHSDFKVIIVGGSVAGLTLAHCLVRANISHVVLEKGTDIAPQLGASVGILPNGGRILQQLGLYDEIEPLMEPMSIARVVHADGFSFTSTFPRLLNEWFGYPVAFLERQKLLDVLYKTYPDKSRIITKAKVTEVQHLDHGVKVVAEDGTIHKGDLIVGADGVHSRIRSEIWRLADVELGQVSYEERAAMVIEYACIFGISSGIPSLMTGELINACLNGLFIATIHGKEGRIFWFIVKKLDQRYVYPDAPHFTPEDAAQCCAHLSNVLVWKDVHVRDLWEARIAVSMVALEEYILKTWHHGRLVLLGDSVHKMTPNFGQGANCAIEDAATLASLLSECVNAKSESLPLDRDIQCVFERYYQQRYNRSKSIYNQSWIIARIQANDGLFYTLLNRYCLPFSGVDMPAILASKVIADAALVTFLPLPRRSGPAWTGSTAQKQRRVCLYRVILSALVLIIGWLAILLIKRLDGPWG